MKYYKNKTTAAKSRAAKLIYPPGQKYGPVKVHEKPHCLNTIKLICNTFILALNIEVFQDIKLLKPLLTSLKKSQIKSN